MEYTREKIKQGSLKVLKKCAMSMTSATVNSACFFLLNQDKLPEEAKKLRKF